MMAAVKSKNTRPELRLRQNLFSRGLRYRLHYKRLPGRPDIVFVSARLVVFVDGDFWHGLGWERRGLLTIADQFPTNTTFWVQKLQRNVERDLEVNEKLTELGWTVLRFYESEVLANVLGVCAVIEREVRLRASR